MEYNNSFEALDLNKEKNTICSSPSTLLKNLTDETACESNSHDTQSIEHKNCLETLDLDKEKNTICSSPSTVLENLTDETVRDSNSHDTQDMVSKSYLKEKYSESDSLACSNDAALDENLGDEIGITTSTIVDDKSYAENEEDIKSPDIKQKRKRDLINQSLSLPYYKMSRPDFHEFTYNVAKNLEVPMKGMQPLNFKPQTQILPLQQLQYQKKCFREKKIVGEKEYADIVLCEGSSTSKRGPSSCTKTKESCSLRREDLIQRLKDQMQKKKEAAFDRHKEIQEADDEICGSDAEEFDKVLDYDDSRSPTPSNSCEDSCILPVEKEFFESAVESISNETIHDLQSSDEENCSEKYNGSGGFMDSPPVSLSLPSYQPNGGFAVESDVSSDSCNSDSEQIPPSETNSSLQSFVIRDSCDLDASEVGSFGLDEVSAICSGRFLSMEEERPWTPSSDSLVNRKGDLDIRSNDGENRVSDEELEPDNSQLKEFHDINNPVGIVSKRKNCDNYTEETFSPPSKKYKKDFIPCESSGIPSSLKIDEIMQDVYEKSSMNAINLSPNMGFHLSKELTNCIAEQQSEETLEDEDNEEMQSVPRIRKCRPLIDDSDEDDETNLSDNQQLIEASPRNQIGNNLNPLRINEFLDEEAELSGDEMSSDESDVDDSNDEAEQGLIPEDLPADEELKEQVANIHYKHERDDDARIVKRLQQDFLPEGDLHFDGSGRQKTFHWSNNVSNDMQNEILSESDPEDNIEPPMQQDKIKWRQETSVKCSDSDTSDVDGKEKTPNFKKLPVSIIGRVLSSQAVFGTNKHTKSSPFTRRHGSLIHVAGSEGLNLNVSSSVQRKTVIFQALSHSDEVNSSTSQALDRKSVFEKLL